MTSLRIEIREYPKDKRIEIEDLTPTGAEELMLECENLLSKLEDKMRG